MPTIEMSTERRRELEAQRYVLLEELEGVMAQLNPKVRFIRNKRGVTMLIETNEHGYRRILRMWR